MTEEMQFLLTVGRFARKSVTCLGLFSTRFKRPTGATTLKTSIAGAHGKARFAALLLMLFCNSSLSPAKQNPSARWLEPRSFSHQNGITTTLNLRDFGAAGDGMSDDGPALQSALDALATSGGGTLYVPPGSYAIGTSVSKDFSALAASIAIEGEESSTAIDVAGNGSGLNLTSEFIIKVGQANVALALKGLETLLIRDVAFVGVQEVYDDAQVVLLVNEIRSVNIEHCEFYGLASLGPGGSIVFAYRSGLKVDQTAFLGCATSSAYSTSIIQNLTWKEIAITNTKFVDYGLRPNFWSKTPLAPPYSWISIGNAESAQPDSFRRDAVIRNVFLDEGGFVGISARPDLFSSSSAPFNVFISAVWMNVTNLGAWGIYLKGVDKVLIEKSHFGWSHNADAAIVLTQVKEAVLDLLECVAHADTIRAYNDTQRLVVINSLYETLDSAAPHTRVITTQNPMDDPIQYVRQQYLDVLGTEPDLQALYFWADLMLRCEDDASCLVEQRNALADYLSAAPPAAFSVAGSIVDQDGAALADVTVSLAGSQSVTVQTDTAGHYTIGNLSTAGQYTLTPSKKHYVFSSQTLNTPTSNQVANFTGVLNRHAIHGRVTDQHGGLAGALLELTGSQTSSATSDPQGNYAFPNLPAGGDYAVTVTRANYRFDTASLSLIDLSTDQAVDFQGVLLDYVISGKAHTTDGAPIVGVSLSLTGSRDRTTVTDSTGNYSFMVPGDGSYIVTPSKLHFEFDPPSLQFGNLSANQSANFTAVPHNIVQFSSVTYTVSEDIPAVEITVNRAGDLSGEATVRYTMTDGTASQNSDYTLAAGVLRFEANETTKSFSVLITNDAWVEQPEETATLTLSDPSGFLLGNQRTATLRIEDNSTAVPTSNPLEDSRTFVTQQYADFLWRIPDQGGLDYWTSQITQCGNDQACIRSRRVGVSAAFFVESEFQQTGGFVFRLYRSTLGRRPGYLEFMQDRGELLSYDEPEIGKQGVADEHAQTYEFLGVYPETLSKPLFIDTLIAKVKVSTGVDLFSERETLLDEYTRSDSRGRVLRLIAENQALQQAEYNRAFVLMQYFGYLRRDPDQAGYDFWLNVVNNQQPGNFRGMVCAFLTSREFQERFSPIVPRTDQECASLP